MYWQRYYIGKEKYMPSKSHIFYVTVELGGMAKTNYSKITRIGTHGLNINDEIQASDLTT